MVATVSSRLVLHFCNLGRLPLSLLPFLLLSRRPHSLQVQPLLLPPPLIHPCLRASIRRQKLGHNCPGENVLCNFVMAADNIVIQLQQACRRVDGHLETSVRQKCYIWVIWGRVGSPPPLSKLCHVSGGAQSELRGCSGFLSPPRHPSNSHSSRAIVLGEMTR